MERPATVRRTADVHGHGADQLSSKVTFSAQGQPLYIPIPPTSLYTNA